MATLYNSDIKVKFIIHNFSNQYVQEITKFYDDVFSIGEVEVIIKECSKVYIEFESKGEKSTLLVENVFQEGGEPFLIYSGQNKMLFELENNYSMLIPGSYVIKITINNIVYYSVFEIVPRHISDEQLKDLREFINSQVSQLSYNMESKLQSIQHSDEIDYISIVKSLNENYRVLKYNFNSIIENPYLTLEKRYVKYGRHERLDRKTVYLNSKGKKNHEYSYKKVKDFNNKQNIIIKSIAIKLINSLIDIEDKLTYAYKQNKAEEAIMKKESEFKKDSINRIRDVSSSVKEVDKRIRSYDQSCNSLTSIQKRKEGIKDNIGVLKVLKTTLSNFVKSTYIKEIPTVFNINYKSVRVEDNRYRSIIKVYNEIYLNRDKKSISYKPSELLYEYFAYLIVVKVFRDNGYELADCEFRNIIELNFIDKIPKGCLVRFVSGNKEVRVWYEKELLSLEGESIQMDNGFYTHAPNKLPDVRIDYYEDKLLVDSIIVESKYRRYSYLWSDVYNTNTMIQIKNYKSTIKYSKDILTKPIYPIQKVIVVYPGQEDVNGIISKDWDDFIFIQLRPDENGGIYGYKELQQALIRK